MTHNDFITKELRRPMTKADFVKALTEQVDAFSKWWDEGVARNPDNYPREMDEPEWFEPCLSGCLP